MPSFEELYRRLARAAVEDRVEEETARLRRFDIPAHALDCLLHPERHPVVWKISDCDCSEEETANCAGQCLFDALYTDENGQIAVNRDLCEGCNACVDRCKAKHLVASKDILPALALVHKGEAPVYAIVAPAFIGQFSEQVTPGKLRTAFKRLGFAGMVEVALFADILTLKEALEFDATIHDDRDFLLTSCCCPMWIGMIRKVYSSLSTHLPGAVSPMVACGRAVKRLKPGAKVVFIGPCLAKKAEAREPDVADAVDYVLTFREVQDIFDFAGIDPAALDEDARDHSSRGGRIYARTGGVSEAMAATVRRLNPQRDILPRARTADGVPDCRALLKELTQGEIDANFLEGMGCPGGCVGGPRAILEEPLGKEHVEHYGAQATYETPLDNPFVIELLHRLGFDTVDQLLTQDDLFTRDLSPQNKAADRR